MCVNTTTTTLPTLNRWQWAKKISLKYNRSLKSTRCNFIKLSKFFIESTHENEKNKCCK